ncbi:MAG: hypothetical protein II336_03415 [Loktanella sp.]|nr:hypothetical protein [Loktanella sp.]
MTRLQAVICERALDSEVPEWVHLLPAGQIEARDGRTFNFSNPDVVLAAFHAGDIDLPIDYQHQNQKAGWQRSGACCRVDQGTARQR